jgi:hypothetical protein
LKTGPDTPAEEEQLNETLGLDALASKLSNLYLNSPNVSKKPPAFHTEDSLNATLTQPKLNDSESDISFNASFIEVLHGSVNVSLEPIENDQVAEPSEHSQLEEPQVAEVAPVTEEAVSEVVVAPEEQAAESTPVTEPAEPENKAEDTVVVVVTAPSPEKLAEEDLINNSKPDVDLAESNELPSTVESLAALSQKAAHSDSFAEQDESTITEEVSLAFATQNQVAVDQSVHEPALEVKANPETPQSAEENSTKEEAADVTVLVEVKESNQTDVFEVPIVPVASETEQQAAVVISEQPLQLEELRPENIVFEESKPEELQPEVPKLEEPKPEEPKSEELKSEEPKVAASEPVELNPEELKPEEPKPEEPHQVEVVAEKPEQEKPDQADQLLEQTKEGDPPEPIKDIEKAEPEKEKPAASVVETVDEQRLPIKCTLLPAEFPENFVSEIAPVIEISVPEPIVEVSFEEPKPFTPEENPIDSSGFVIEFTTKPKKAIPARFRTDKSSKEHIPKEDKPSPVQVKEVDSEPEKEVSVEKPFEERKVCSAPVFVQHTRGVLTPHKDPLTSSTSSLSELLDLCKKQQQNLDVDDELDKKVDEEANELEQLLASGANLICDELNASFDEIHGAMSGTEVPVTPPRRSRSPRKASPARNAAPDPEDPFKTKSLFVNSPAQGTVAKKMDGTSSPMTSSSESAIASSRINMVSTYFSMKVKYLSDTIDS